ncbi:hypothetical protein GE061_014028 [Apolygus lucorum]|uniref:Transmembrane protein n=1 Tax=Apolygus lucorum TaxID=248454 RepID=A0A8S9XS59_APOLU|nr:hypothetical protein GE061_014028 [Apolygus lucorum]
MSLRSPFVSQWIATTKVVKPNYFRLRGTYLAFTMVCVPCYLMPLLLILWKFLQPFIAVLWTPKKPVEAKKNSDDLQEDEGPSGTAEKPKNASCPITASGASKKDD